MKNRVCEILKIKYPIIQGGMGNVSDAGLASAISNAGGLGTIGVGTLPIKEAVERMKTMREGTTQSCCVNIPVSVHPNAKQAAEEAVNHGIPIVSLSAGNPKPFIPFFKEHGVTVICVTASVKQAKKAEEAGADIIVCEGYEAAGINSPLESTTLTLVPQIKDAVKIPVIAAGGIADGRGMAAVMSLGADGVQMGTRFIATEEAPFHKEYKQMVLNANDQATVIVGRKHDRIRRLMRTEYADKLLEMEKGILSLEEFMALTDESLHVKGAMAGELDKGFINSGQIAGLIHETPSVKELLKTMMGDAQQALLKAISQFET